VLSHDFALGNQNDPELGTAYCLQEMAGDLEEHGMLLNDYGLPEPNLYNNEVQHEINHWSGSALTLLDQVAENLLTFSEEKKRIYNLLWDHIECQEPLCAFIDGKAGCGKTFLINTLCNQV
jgi:hypothetical protein